MKLVNEAVWESGLGSFKPAYWAASSGSSSNWGKPESVCSLSSHSIWWAIPCLLPAVVLHHVNTLRRLLDCVSTPAGMTSVSAVTWLLLRSQDTSCDRSSSWNSPLLPWVSWAWLFSVDPSWTHPRTLNSLTLRLHLWHFWPPRHLILPSQVWPFHYSCCSWLRPVPLVDSSSQSVFQVCSDAHLFTQLTA